MDRKSSPQASDRPAKCRRDSREGRDDDGDIDREKNRNESRQRYDEEGSRSRGYDRGSEYHQRGRSRDLRSRSRSRSPRSRTRRYRSRSRSRSPRSRSWRNRSRSSSQSPRSRSWRNRSRSSSRSPRSRTRRYRSRSRSRSPRSRSWRNRSQSPSRSPSRSPRSRTRRYRSRSRSQSPRSRSWRNRSRSPSRSPRSRTRRNRTRKSRSESWERQEHDQRGRQDYGEYRSGPATHRRHGYEELRKPHPPSAQNSSRSTAMPSSQCPPAQSRRSTLVPAPSHFPLKPYEKELRDHGFKHSVRLPKAGEAQVTITLPGLGHSIAPLGNCYINVADGLIFNCTLDAEGVWSFNDGVHVLGAEGGCLVMPEHDSIIYDDLTKTLNIDASEDLYLTSGCVVSIKRFALSLGSLYPIRDNFKLDTAWPVPHEGIMWKDSWLPKCLRCSYMLLGPGGLTVSEARELARDTLIPGLAPPGVPGGRNVPGGTLLAKGTLIPANTCLAGGTRLTPRAVHLPRNTIIPGGTILAPGFVIPAGSRFPRGTSFPPMRRIGASYYPIESFPGGTHWPDGRKLLDDNDSDVEASGVLPYDGTKARANEGAADESKVAKGDAEALAMDVTIVGLQRDPEDKVGKGKELEGKGLDDKYGNPGGMVGKLDVEDDKTNLHAELARLQQEARAKDEKIKQLDTEKNKADQAVQRREDELRQDARLKDEKIKLLNTEIKKVHEAARKREEGLQKEVRAKDQNFKWLHAEKKKADQAAQKREDELRQEAQTKDKKIKQLDTEKKKADQAAQKREEANQAAQKREDELRQDARLKDKKIKQLDTEMKNVHQAARKREDELRQEAQTKDEKIKRLQTEKKKADQAAQKGKEVLREEPRETKDKLRTSARNEVAKDRPVAANPTNDSRGSGSGDKAGGDGDDEVALFRFPGDRDGAGDSGGQIDVTVRVVQNRRSRSNQRSQGRAGRRR